MTPREIAERYVRGKCPELLELSFGCEVEVQNYAVLVKVVEDRRGFTWVPESGYPQMDFYGIAPSPVHFDEKHIKQIIGHPIQLQHWLRVLDGKCCTIYLHPDVNMADGAGITYDLTTGQPATVADYQAFNTIVGV